MTGQTKHSDRRSCSHESQLVPSTPPLNPFNSPTLLRKIKSGEEGDKSSKPELQLRSTYGAFSSMGYPQIAPKYRLPKEAMFCVRAPGSSARAAAKSLSREDEGKAEEEAHNSGMAATEIQG